jgi:hypothetical protein
MKLQRELEECHQNIENLPFPQSEEEKPHSLFPLREVPLRGSDIGFINAPLPAVRSEILKRNCDSFLRIPSGSQNGLINFWDHR